MRRLVFKAKAAFSQQACLVRGSQRGSRLRIPSAIVGRSERSCSVQWAVMYPQAIRMGIYKKDDSLEESRRRQEFQV
jgi:hypothetical protein